MSYTDEAECIWRPSLFPSACFELPDLVNASLAFVFAMGMVAGACLLHIWQTRDATPEKGSSESGNVFFVLFAAIGMIAVLTAGVGLFMRGPVASMSNVTRYNIAQNDMQAAVALISQISLNNPAADCDADGKIEPLPFRAGTAAYPAGGGVLPDGVGANRRDPWGTDYGYCVWDYGTKTVPDDIAACGGAGANRRAGGNTSESAVIAVITAGPDKVFQTGCANWTDSATPVVVKAAGSDDVMRVIPYAQLVITNDGNMKLQELPDEACTPDTIGIMRLFLGTPQICLEDGWSEMGAAPPTLVGNFVDVMGAVPASTNHLSGQISFTGFAGTKPLTVQGGAALLVNGNPVSAPVKIAAGDTIELRADASSNPEETLVFSVTLSGIKREWTIATRDKYPPSLTITPPSANFTVAGPGSPAYSPATVFVVRNTGEQPTAPLQVTLTPLSSYEFTGNGDECEDVELAPHAATSDQCLIDIRAKSSGGAIPAGTLTVTDGGTASATAILSGVITGFVTECPPLPGPSDIGCIVTANGSIYIGNHGGYRVYAAAADQGGSLQWKTSATNTTGTTNSDNGTSNTNAMIAAGAAAHPAGNACKTKAPAGTWYLPARNELELVWLNRAAINLAVNGFNTSGYYWSSTQDSSAGAWGLDLSASGALEPGPKVYSYLVRCVRNDAPPPDCTTGPIGTACDSDGAIYIGTVGSNRIYAAAADESGTKIWSVEHTETGATSATNGQSNSNNTSIVSKGAAVYPAVFACRNKAPAGTWYLPAKDELNLVWTNRVAIGLAAKGFDTSGNYYYSSTEYYTNASWIQRLSDGTQLNGSKYGDYLVRCVRR